MLVVDADRFELEKNPDPLVSDTNKTDAEALDGACDTISDSLQTSIRGSLSNQTNHHLSAIQEHILRLVNLVNAHYETLDLGETALFCLFLGSDFHSSPFHQ